MKKPIELCYLVPAGDYWRLSFVSYEKTLMREVLREDIKKYCFQAIKCLRDEISLTDDYETALLSSYPLKVSFMKECLQHPAPWPDHNLANHVISILDRMEQEGSSGSLTSYYVENDPIFPGNSDRSHIEVRRMIHYLSDQTSLYYSHGTVHAILWLLFTAWQVGLGIMSAIIQYGKHLAFNANLSSDDVLMYPSVHLTLSALAFITPLFGMIWIRASCSTMLYRLYRFIIKIYIFMMLMGAGQLMVSITISVIKEQALTQATPSPLNKSFSIAVLIDKRLMQKDNFITASVVSLALSGIVVFLMVSHVVMVTVYGRECIRRYNFPRPVTERKASSCLYHCEIVFCDDVYRNLCIGANSRRTCRREYFSISA